MKDSGKQQSALTRAIADAATSFGTKVDMDYRRWFGVSGVLAGLVVVVINFVQGDTMFATILLGVVSVCFGLLMWWTQPGRGGPHISHAAARAAAGDGDVIVYWRPGCVFCDQLRLGLGKDRHDVSWVNILRDSDAAEFVAACHEGDEVVPTAVTGRGELIDATPGAIRAQLGSS